MELTDRELLVSVSKKECDKSSPERVGSDVGGNNARKTQEEREKRDSI